MYVNGWHEVARDEAMNVKSIALFKEYKGKGFSPNLIHTCPNVSVSNEAEMLFQYFTTPAGIGRSSPPAIAHALEYLVEVPS